MPNFGFSTGVDSLSGGIRAGQDTSRLLRGKTPENALKDPELAKLAIAATNDIVQGQNTGAYERYVSGLASFTGDFAQANEMAQTIVGGMVNRAKTGQRNKGFTGLTQGLDPSDPRRSRVEGLMMGLTPDELNAGIGGLPKPMNARDIAAKEKDEALKRKTEAELPLIGQPKPRTEAQVKLDESRTNVNNARADSLRGLLKSLDVTETDSAPPFTQGLMDQALFKLTQFITQNEDSLLKLSDKQILNTLNGELAPFNFEIPESALPNLRNGVFFKGLDEKFLQSQVTPKRRQSVRRKGKSKGTVQLPNTQKSSRATADEEVVNDLLQSLTPADLEALRRDLIKDALSGKEE